MADWTTIADATLEPGKPWRSVDALAVRDNPIAIAEGASGAPRIVTTALNPPTGASTNLLLDILGNTAATTSTASYLSAGLPTWADVGNHVGFHVLVPGTVRVSFEHQGDSDGSDTGDSIVRILKNGVLVQEYTVLSSGFVARSNDIAVTTGDRIILQQKSPTAVAGQWKNIRVYSGNTDMAVCT